MVLDLSEKLNLRSITTIFKFINDVILKDQTCGYQAVEQKGFVSLLRALDNSGLSLTDKYHYIGCPFPIADAHRLCNFSDWVKKHGRAEEIRLPDYLGRLSQGRGATDRYLLRCEVAVKELTAYLWLAQRFPRFYPDVEAAKSYKAEINKTVENLLQSKALKRVCRKCGIALKKQHPFPICNSCHRSRYRHREFDDDWW